MYKKKISHKNINNKTTKKPIQIRITIHSKCNYKTFYTTFKQLQTSNKLITKKSPLLFNHFLYLNPLKKTI